MRFPLFILSLFLLLSCNEQAKKNAEQKKPFTNLTACLFSEIAYCSNPQEQMNTYLPEWKIVWDATALNGNHALVVYNGNTYVIAIRGSLMEFSWDAFENWVYQDLNIVSQEDWSFSNIPGAKVSTGFYRGWKNIIQIKDKTSGQDLLTFLLTHTTGKDPICITGHSLGGNLATVLASWVDFKLKEAARAQQPVNVITFAAPAAGNEKFADDFDKRFPQSERIENTGDIVPKFPVTDAVATLSSFYASVPSAADITVGYKNMNVPLSSVFKTISSAMTLLEYKNGFSHFKQTNGNGTSITIKPSGKNISNDAGSWFAEAGYQHGIGQYAAVLGVPVIVCK
jgi:triacylglycerol lipase